MAIKVLAPAASLPRQALVPWGQEPEDRDKRNYGLGEEDRYGPEEEERSYGLEVRQIVDSFCQGTWTAPQSAIRVVEYLRANDPELLAGFLDLHAVAIIRDMINERDRSTRSHNRQTASRSVFRNAAEAFDDGDPEPLTTHFLSELYIVEDGTKKALKDMRAEDLTFAANEYRRRSRELQMQEAFLRALAKKCKTQSVGAVFDEDQIALMWISLSAAGS